MANPMPKVSSEAVNAAQRAIGLTESASREPTATELALAQAGVTGIAAAQRNKVVFIGGAAAAGLALGFLLGRR